MHFSDSEWLDAVAFKVVIDGSERICWISYQALRDRFGASKDTDVRKLMANIEEIGRIAVGVYRRTPAGDRVTVRNADFDQPNSTQICPNGV